MVKAESRGEEGAVYVWEGGLHYTKPPINSTTLLDCIQNKYVFDAVNKLKSMIFTKKYTLEVLDPEREVDIELTKRLTSMAEAVRLWPKIQVGWTDSYRWGVALFNPVWDWVDNEYVLIALRRLPPESFANQTTGSAGTFYDEILRGICVRNGEVEYWQTSGIGATPKRIKNIFALKDPTLPGMAGQSMLIPLVPIISMVNFTWKAQLQKVNRVGAPNIFIKVTEPRGAENDPESDLNYAQKILNNWGKDSAYQLRENMTVENLSVSDNESALKTIQELVKEIKDYFNPASLLKKDGVTLGGNAGAEKDQTDIYIASQHSWTEDAWEPLFDTYLEANGYEGYEVQIYMGEAATALGDLERAQAETGFSTRTLSPNEIREKLGLGSISEDELGKMADLWEIINPPQSMGFPMINREHQRTPEERSSAKKIREAQALALDAIIRGL